MTPTEGDLRHLLVPKSWVTATTVTLTTNLVDSWCAFCVYDDAGVASVPVGTAYTLDVGDGAAAALSAITITSS